MVAATLLVAGVAGGVGLILLFVRHRYAVVVIDGESMLPMLRPGDRVLLRRTRPSAVRTGQVVVLGDRRAAGTGRERLIVKRIAALPGDPAPFPVGVDRLSHLGEAVPSGHIAVLGDNAEMSLDSRQCGYIDQNRIQGVVLRSMSTVRKGRR